MDAWRAKLAAGDVAGAGDLFITRYRRLIFAVIRRTVADDDDVADVFAELSNDLARLASGAMQWPIGPTSGFGGGGRSTQGFPYWPITELHQDIEMKRAP